MAEKDHLLLRKKIFSSELEQLKNENFITEEEHSKLQNSYESFYLSKLNAENQASRKMEKIEIENKTSIENVKPKIEKKKLTPEQLRERNITWTLITGVLMLLIGGIVLATTNWESMNSLIKTSLIVFISLLFFGISWVSGKLLKIEKTSFAFMTLGALFIPISVLSIGFFKLFGPWLSIYGEGKYILGLIGTIIWLPIYTWISIRYQSRLYIWLTLLSSTIGIAFLLQALNTTIDIFYLGIILFNALLLILYHKQKNNKKIKIFLGELPAFSQLNLILSTLLMLAFYNNPVFYSFNILLTASLYVSMIFVYNTVHYHYVFTGMLVYGLYQLINHTALENLNYILYASVGLIYIGLQHYLKDNNYLNMVFKFTSGIVSFFAFIFISFEGIFLKYQNSSLSSTIVMLIAYFIISFNYIYLSQITKTAVFRYLAPIFLLVAGYQSWVLLDQLFEVDFMELYLFIYALVLFLTFNQLAWLSILKPVKQSGLIIFLFAMLGFSTISLINLKWGTLAIQLFILGLIFYLIYKEDKIDNFKQVSYLIKYMNPVFWTLSLTALYGVMEETFIWYSHHLHLLGHIAISALLILAFSFIWERYGQPAIARATLYTSTAVYSLALIGTIIDTLVDKEFVLPTLLFISIGVYIVLVLKTRINFLYYLVAIASLGFYLSLVNPLNLTESPKQLSTYLLFGSIYLIIIYEMVGSKYGSIKPAFFITVHFYLPFTILFSLIVAIFRIENIHPNNFLIPIGIYIYSIFRTEKEWAIKTFLYSTFTLLPIYLYLNLIFYPLNWKAAEEYILILTSGLISLFWLLTNKSWRDRTSLYLVSFTNIALLVFTMRPTFTTADMVIAILIAVWTMYLLHYHKWNLLLFIPLLFTLITLSKIETHYVYLITLYTGFGIMTFFGKFVFHSLYKTKDKRSIIYIDWYTLFAFIYLMTTYTVVNLDSATWLQMITPVLFVVLTYITLSRINQLFLKEIFKLVIYLTALYPYYILIVNLNIPKLIEYEVYLLPWMILTVLITVKDWGERNKQAQNINFGFILLLFAILVYDGLMSNTLNDAFIVGGLSLLSILGGMHYRIKSYFLIGTGVLLLNILLQTKPFWGRMPWWAYLVIGGTILIGFASFYEWQKQKKDHKGNTILESKRQKLISTFKKWN